MLAMVVLPLPPLVLDALFTFNIVLSLIVMLAVHAIRRHHTREPDDRDGR